MQISLQTLKPFIDDHNKDRANLKKLQDKVVRDWEALMSIANAFGIKEEDLKGELT